MMRVQKISLLTHASALAILAVFAACSPRTEVSPADTAGSDVAAKVNGVDLSVRQIELAVQKQHNGHPEAALSDTASKQVLEQLIDEEIIAQKAVAAKLDKDPKVVQQLEAARRDILARRFIEAAADTVAKAPDDQVQKFYDSHPALFSQRKIYTLQRLEIQVADERRAEVDAHVRSLKSSAELTDWLKAQNLRFAVRQEQDASEQLPLPVLDKLVTMKEGESTVVPSPSGMTALTLTSSVPAPKTLGEAHAAIEQFLSIQGRRQVIVDVQKGLRDGAKVEYEGRFAASAPLAGNGSSAVVASPMSSATAGSAAGPAPQNDSNQK